MTSERTPDVATWEWKDLSLGLKVTGDYVLTTTVYRRFLDAFDDRSPVHVDEAFAQAAGFSHRVMHGAILNGFLSHFVGMRLPGERALLLSADLRYLAPCYDGDVLCLEGEVRQLVESQKVMVMSVLFHNRTQGKLVARAQVQVKVRE